MTNRHGSPAYVWGATPAECARSQPCDRYLADADDVLFRAIDIDAPPQVAFRWLCQLRVAPYSYDWIDNRGRQSSLTLSPGLDNLERGQRVMGIFRLVEFKRERHLTILLDSPRAAAVPGPVAITYALTSQLGRSRLVVKLLLHYPPGLLGTALRYTFPLADLIMMRKQLLTLKGLAEAHARSGD
jgi:hypothetical protein